MLTALVNNQYVMKDAQVVSLDSAAYTAGDGIFETVALVEGKMPLLHEHFSRFEKSCAVLDITLPDEWNSSWWRLKIFDLAARNQLTSARVRLQLCRTSQWNISMWPLKAPFFAHACTTAALLHEPVCLFNSTSFIKTTSRQKYALAKIFAARKNVSECILLNAQGQIAECINGNVFIVKGESIYTPPLSSGCVAGVMRHFILEKCSSQFAISEKDITPAELLAADEVFFSNAIRGVQSFSSIENIMLGESIAQQLSTHLQSILAL